VTIGALTNVDETGSWSHVDPEGAELYELLVILYTPERAVALYWSDSID
jgi:hypothetical protein